ncbi:MAG: zf-HC2 domain-containing protein, partial [Actinomycetota bacterium]
MNLEHERCSELLGPLLRGELSERETALVKEHLAGCEECRAERLGLEALAGAPGVMAVSAEPLSELERARLHRAVSAALPHPRTIVPDTPKPWVARLAPYLGAAAALVLVVFGVTQMDLGGSDEDAGFSTRDEAGDGGAGRAPE